MLLPIRRSRFHVGDLVRAVLPAGAIEDAAVVAAGVDFLLRPKVRVLKAGTTFEIDAGRAELVRRGSA